MLKPVADELQDQTGGTNAAAVPNVDAELSRRRVILDAALDCFSEHGYAATGISHIRLRSGASVGSIYHHFGSKEGIASALYLDCLDRYRLGLLASLSRVDEDDARALVCGIVRFHLKWAAANPQRARYLHAMRREEPVLVVEEAIHRGTSGFLRKLHLRFKVHMERGRIKILPNEVITAQLIGPAQELLRLWFSGRSQVGPAEAAEQLAAAAWCALGQPSPEHTP